MEYIDYREKLGLGFNDNQKCEMLKNIVNNILKKISNDYNAQSVFFGNRDVSYIFCQVVGEIRYNQYDFSDIITSINNEKTIQGIISKFIVLVNICKDGRKEALLNIFEKHLTKLNISYEIITEDNDFFIFSKGAKELDSKLVSEPLEWLKDYPNAQKQYIRTLRQYADKDFAQDIADNLRKTLEEFLREFFNNSKNLSNNKTEVGKYLESKQVDKDLRELFMTLLSNYEQANNSVAKHHDNINYNMLEFVLYQTGTFIRTLIQLDKDR